MGIYLIIVYKNHGDKYVYLYIYIYPFSFYPMTFTPSFCQGAVTGRWYSEDSSVAIFAASAEWPPVSKKFSYEKWG
jgi:hypothetical protein